MLLLPGRKIMVLASTQRTRDIPIKSIGYIARSVISGRTLTPRQLQHFKEYGAFINYPSFNRPTVKYLLEVVFSRMGRNKPCVKRKTVTAILPDISFVKDIKSLKVFLKAVNSLNVMATERNLVVLSEIDSPVPINDLLFNELTSLLYSLILFVNKNSIFLKLDSERHYVAEAKHKDSVIDRINTDNIILARKSWKLLRMLTPDLKKGQLYKRALYKEHILPTIMDLQSMVGQLQKASINEHLGAAIDGTIAKTRKHVTGDIYDMYFVPKELHKYIDTKAIWVGDFKIHQRKMKQLDNVKRLLKSLSTD